MDYYTFDPLELNPQFGEKALGISYSEWLILEFINGKKNTSLKYIYDETGWEKEKINECLVRLINLQYLECKKGVYVFTNRFIQTNLELDLFIKKKFSDFRKISSETIDRTFVYVAHDGQSGFYKIGKSKNPKMREKTLRAEVPLIVFLIIQPEATGFNERILHKQFAEKRLRGEWFRLAEEDIEIIREMF